jgi:sodium/proline symporter
MAANPDRALFVIADRALPPWLAVIVGALILCALLANIGSRLLVIAASLSADTKRATSPLSYAWARVVLVLFTIVVLCFALYAHGSILEQAMFAFSVMGSAFGPLLLVRLAGKRVRPGSTLGAMWTGFILTWLFHVLPDSPGDFLERVFPFVAALGIALSGGERRRNPDRADRSQQTVHDRVPI